MRAAGVFPISPHLANLYLNETDFRWSQRVITGQVVRRTRKGRGVVKRKEQGAALLCSFRVSFSQLWDANFAEPSRMVFTSPATWLSLVDNGAAR